jgi:hypothetical protein
MRNSQPFSEYPGSHRIEKQRLLAVALSAGRADIALPPALRPNQKVSRQSKTRGDQVGRPFFLSSWRLEDCASMYVHGLLSLYLPNLPWRSGHRTERPTRGPVGHQSQVDVMIRKVHKIDRLKSCY